MPSTETVDGVERYPWTGLKVLVIGGGIGGMAAALECWRKGLDPVVLERMPEQSQIGDGFSITPSGLSTLHHYPGMFAAYHEKIYDMTVHLYRPDGKQLSSTVPEWKLPGSPEKTASPKVNHSLATPRAAFARMQLEQVQRLGIPVHWGTKVTGSSEDDEPGKIVIHTEGGERFVGDVAIAADGVGTKTHHLSGSDEMRETGFAIARAGFSTKDLKPGSKAWELVPKAGESPQFRAYIGPQLHLVLLLTDDFLSFAYTHRDFGDASESWNNQIDAKQIIESLRTRAEWDPAVISYVEQIPNRITDWKLALRDPNPTWTSPKGRMVQLGDAAHPFLPSAAAGGTQAIEDAVSIAECLRLGKDDIPLATQVHNTLRFQRVSIIQRTGFTNRRELYHATEKELEEGKKGSVWNLGRWMWGHCPEVYAHDNFEAAAAHIKDGAEFHNTNLPPGHVYEPWTVKSEMEQDEKGIPPTLKQNGDWSV